MSLPRISGSVTTITLAVAGLFVVFHGVSPLSAGDNPRQLLSEVGITPRLDAQVPLDAAFVDHHGKRVTIGEPLGRRPIVLCLVYFRCPMLCNLTADGLVKALVDLPGDVGQDFDVLMVSFDPRDGPQQAATARHTALQRYGRAGADEGWHTWTGQRPAIEALTESVGFRYRWDESLQQYAHGAGLVVLTPDGRVSSYLDGVRFAPRELAEAIDQASDGDVAQAAPTTFLRCYLYDPTTGKFGAAVQWTLRGLGLFTVVGLTAGIVRLSRRERSANFSPSPNPQDE